VAVDSVGNVYAAGSQSGTGTFDYGNGVKATGTYSDGINVVLVKYNSSGTAQWARSVAAGTDRSAFHSVATDNEGNVYAAGFQVGTGTYNYGNGITVTGTYSDGINVVLVKYSSSGAAQWARSLSTGTDLSRFTSVAVDSAGNVYAAGWQSGSGTYNYGNGVTVAGTYSRDSNVVLVKYNSSGTTQWARSVSAGTNRSWFTSVATDGEGNVYAAGFSGTGTFDYGNSVMASGVSNTNVVLVKYNSSGTAQWAQSVSAGTNDRSEFRSVTVDSTGDIYATGFQSGTGTYGNGVTVTGSGTVFVKYSSSGMAQWARAGKGSFNFMALDSADNVYVAGFQRGTGTIDYGNGVTATGSHSGGGNAVLVKYSE
jgi:hypothetical protein